MISYGNKGRPHKWGTLDDNFVNTVKSSRQILLSHSLIQRSVSVGTVKFSRMTEVRMLSKTFIQELFFAYFCFSSIMK